MTDVAAKLFVIGLVAFAALGAVTTHALDADKSKTKLDLSTPKNPGGRWSHHRNDGSTTGINADAFTSVDLGTGKLRLDGSRNRKDLVHEATGFDQDPGSTTFRSLAPASKTGTPPYVGFTLTAPR